MKLDAEALKDAIDELAHSVRKNSALLDEDIREFALNYSISPAVLREQFLSRYPDGLVPPAQPAEAERKLAARQRDLENLIAHHTRELGRFDKFDGRIIEISGATHTIIFNNNSTRTLYAVDHLRVAEVNFSHANLKKRGFPVHEL